MEALRTQMDTLQWELNRLQAENRRLKEENPDVGRVVTLEAELEQAKSKVARLTERVSANEKKLASECARVEAASRAPSAGDTR